MTKEKWLWTFRFVVPLLLFVLIFAGAAFAFGPVTAEAEELRFLGGEDYWWHWDWTWNEEDFDFAEVVEYSRLEEVSFSFSFPLYSDFSNRQTTCAVVAGSEIIGYYDRYNVQLIPNFTPGTQWSWGYTYKNTQSAILPLQYTLYDLMGTDKTGSGTTVEGFDKGLRMYIEGQGYQLRYHDAQYQNNSGGLNFNRAIELIEAEIPVTLLLVGYNLSSILIEEDHVKIAGFESQEGHALNASGYTILRYYDENDMMFREDRFLKVSNLISSDNFNYLLLGRPIKTAYAMGIEIY